MGFPDVVDANGNVLIPAEAFGWGGRLLVAIPSDVTDFNEVPGQPNHVLGATLTYNFTSGFYTSVTGYQQGSFAGNSMLTLKVPEATTCDLNFGFRAKKWEIYTSIVNITNEKVYLTGLGTPVGWLNTKFMQSIDVSIARRF
jgi:outer membrane receptor protein involved in Fe transport